MPSLAEGSRQRCAATLLGPIYIQRRVCVIAAMSLPNGLQSDSTATGNLVAVAVTNAGCNSTGQNVCNWFQSDIAATSQSLDVDGLLTRAFPDVRSTVQIGVGVVTG